MTRIHILKSILFIPVFFVATAYAEAATYYISASDAAASDTNTPIQAQSQATPWKSIARVNTALETANPGDTFLFKRGDTFVGEIDVARSGTAGSPIVFGAYGSGAKPIISGFATIAGGWTNVGGNIWEIDAPTGVDTQSTLVINGEVMPLARWPRATAGNGGYLMSDSGATVSLTDAALLGAPAFSAAEGTEVVVRTNHWTLTRASIATVSGTTIGFPSISSRYAVGANMGYFLQNSAAFLAENGDWAYNTSTRKLRLYYAGTPPTISVSSIDQLVSLNTADNLTFSDLSFQGAKINGMYGNTSSGITVDSSEVRYAGQYAIRFNYSGTISVTNSLIAESQNNGIFVYSPTLTGVTIRGNTFTNTGIRPGAIAKGMIADLLHAINVSVASTATIESNTIDTTGYVGIRFQGSNLSISKNIINRFTTVLDDGAAIYTYNRGDSPSSVDQWSARTVANNIISNGIGAGAGTASGAAQSYGIYLDLNTNNVSIANNTIFDVASKGITLNSPQQVSITDNTIYNTQVGVGFNRIHDGVSGGQDISGITMNGNALFQTANDQSAIQYVDFDINYPSTSTVDVRVAAMGAFGSNHYRLRNPSAFAVSYRTTPGGSLTQNPGRSLAQWKAFSNLDATSSEIVVPTYKINSQIGSSMVTSSSTFETGITGVTGFGSLCTYAPDTTSKLTGTGSLKVTVVTPTTSATAHCESSGRINPVTSGKKYVLRFSTIGTTSQGSFQVTLMHKSSSPIVLTPWQKGSFGTTRTEHEFLFDSPLTDSAPSWIIDMYAQPGGSLYIDNVEVYEVDASLLSDSEATIFAYNDTATPKTVTFTGRYTDVKSGTIYTTSMSLPAYTSTILLKSTGTPPVPTPDTTAPTVSLTSPASGATVSGTTVSLTATAADAVGVSRVDFYYGTTLIGTDTVAPYALTWTTTGIANGPYVLTAVATDAAGNSRTSTQVAVTVSNLVTDTTAPTISLVTPVSTTVSGTVTLTATASDNIAVTRVEFFKDSDTSPFATDTTAPYTASFSTTSVANGAHTIKATAFDAAGNRRTSNTLTLTVSNATPPTTTTTTPSSGGGGGGGSTTTETVVQTPTTPDPTTPAPALPVAPLSTVPGCTSGYRFSPINGKPCAGIASNVSTTAMPSLYNFGPTTLRVGSRGEGVKELQRFLNHFLNLGLKVDGILGPKTIAVMKTWQSQHGLKPDGLIGPKTKAMMNQIAATQ